MTWQPINTAPKDGTAVLLFDPTHNQQKLRNDGDEIDTETRVFVGYYDPTGDGWTAVYYSNVWSHHATHWAPLPPNPSSDA